MTDNSVSVADVVADAAAKTPARNIVFASPADDPRARRPVDAAMLVVSVLVALLSTLTHTAPADFDVRAAEFFADGLPGWISAVFTIIFILGGLYALGLIIAIWVFGEGRSAIARDMILAGVLAFGATTVAALLAGPEWPDILPELLERDGVASFPVSRVAFAVAVLRVASPYLSVPMRNVGRRLLLPMAASAIILGYGSISAVIGGYAIGVAAAATIHLIFGSGIGIPSKARIAGALSGIALDPDRLTYLDQQPVGATLARAELTDGRTVLVKAYGRDAADAAFASRLWRSMWYRDDGRALSATGLQQVEHESLMLLEGARAGVRVPELISWGRGEAGDAVIATTWLEGDRLAQRSADEIDDLLLAQCWNALSGLAAAGLAHGSIDAHRLVIVGDHVVFDDFSTSELAVDDMACATDVAQMLVTTTLAVGADRAIAAARDGIDDDRLAKALEVLQRSALSSALQRDVREAKLSLKGLRSEVAAAIETELPDLVQLVRVTWGSVAMVALAGFAAYALITSLADIGLDTIADEVADARWSWVAVAFILAQLTNVGEYVSLTGMLERPVPFGPTIMLRYAISFISLAVPSEVGAIAMNVRYMQRLGVSSAAAVAQGPLLTIFSKGFDIILLVVTSRIIGQTVDLDDVDSGPILRLLLLVLVLAVIGVITTFAVPSVRRRVLGPVKEGFSAVKGSVTDPERLMRVAGGTLMSRLLFAMTLSAAVATYGGSISFSQAIFVNSAVSLVVGLMPVPGGIGVGEAALTAGLVTVGVPESSALAAAITHRMVTVYIPPVYGWYTTRWLTERDYL